MKKFIYKTNIIIIIISLFVITINYFGDAANLFSKSKELEIVEMLKNTNVENISNYDERVFQKKFINNLKIKPEIVAFGSSRVFSIGSDLFDGQIFINNGVSGASIEDIIAIFQMYKSKDFLPKKIILGVDPWIFNLFNGQTRWLSIKKEYDSYNNLEKTEVNTNFMDSKYGQLLSPSYFQSSIKKVYKNYLYNEKTKLAGTTEKYNLGNTKLMDGSLVYNQKIREITDDQVDIIARADVQAKSIYSLNNFQRISPELYRIFEQFCLDILDRDIELSFFLSPYHPLVYEKINQDFGIVLNVEKRIIEFANNNGIKVIGSYSPKKSVLSSKDFFDGMHLRRTSMKFFNFN